MSRPCPPSVPRPTLVALLTLALATPLRAHDAFEVTTPGKPGTDGRVPALAGFGSGSPGTPGVLRLEDALPLSIGTWVVGASELALPFQGGVLGPAVDVVVPALPTDALGRTHQELVLPPVSVLGTRAWIQAWVVDPGAVLGMSASNTLALTIQPDPPADDLFLGTALLLPEPTEDLLVTDLDGDGRPDVLALHALPGQVAVLPGLGAGLLGTPTFHAIGNHCDELHVADIDGDGLRDLIGRSRVHEEMRRAPGLPDGGFGPPQVFADWVTPVKASAVGDMDGDGVEDVVVVRSPAATWRDDGQGGMLEGPTTFVHSGVTDATTADLDLDGDLDLVACGETTGEGALVVLLGLGDGSFAPAAETASGAVGPVALDVGDLQLDGAPDVVVVHAAGWASVHRGTGSGGFQPVLSYKNTVSPADVLVADLDGDGRQDVASSSVHERLDLRRGLGDGQLGARFPLHGRHERLAAGDLDGDGRDELLTGDHAGVVHLGELTGPQFGTAGQGASLATILRVLGDVDGDGLLDLVGGSATTQSVIVYLGVGDGTFGAPILSASPGMSRPGAVHQLDNDVHADLLALDAGGVSLRRGLGGGLFGPPIVWPLSGFAEPRVYAHGDVDGNGAVDFAVGRSDGVVSVWFGSGLGDFSAPVDVAMGDELVALELVDADGDGLLDVVAVDPDDQTPVVLTRLGGGSTSFGPLLTSPIPGTAISDAGLGDVNGDGVLDLLAGSEDDGLLVLLGQGDGHFTATTGPTTTIGLWSLEVLDVNGDGLLDAVGWAIHAVAVHLGRGDGRFGAPVLFDSDAQLVGDVDADGHPDLVDPGDGLVLLNRLP